jgi:hypothetical protein
MRTELGAPRADFVGSHELIPVILGATAFLNDVALCAEEPSDAQPPDPATVALLVDALLGLLALRRTLRRWTEAAAAAEIASDGPPPATTQSSDGSYLR